MNKLNNTTTNNTNGKEVVNMRKGLKNTLELCRGNLNKGIASWKMQSIFAKAGDVESEKKCRKILNKRASIKAHIDFIQQKSIKNEIKRIETVIIRGVEISCYEDEYQQTNIVTNTVVKAQQESVLLRESGLEDVIIGDDKMCLQKKGSYDILSINLCNYDPNNKVTSLAVKLFVANGIFVKFNTKTGLSVAMVKASSIDDINLKKNEAVFKYEYLGITPSGLKNHSFLAAATEKKFYGKEAVKEDNRIKLLDKTLGTGFVHTFLDKDGLFKMFDKKKAFKLMGRVLLGAPGSKEMNTINNYLVFNNIAEKANYKKNGKVVDCSNTQDGAVFISVEKVMEQENFKEFSKKEVLHQCVQSRGANNALKGASEILERRDVKFLASCLLNNNTTLEYVVIENNRITAEEFNNLSEEEQNEFLDKLDMIADTNAIKIYEHEGEFKLVWMKHAYTSESSLNMVVNMMLAAQDPTRGCEVISKLVKRALAKKFEAFGFEIELDENASIISTGYNVETKKNNEGQFTSFLMKNSPKTMMYLLPSLLKGMMNSSLEGIANMMNTFKAEMKSLYTVVQADPSPLFGVRVIENNEVFCPSFKGYKEVCGVRHPISGPKAITHFNILSLDTIIDRIADLKVNYAVKEFLVRYYQSVKTFAIIPASHYLMEKHDGMDFDIDAMQFILEEEVVDILKDIEEVGTVIEETDSSVRYILTNEENKIVQFKESKDNTILKKNNKNVTVDKLEPKNEREKEERLQGLAADFSRKITTNANIKENTNGVKMDFLGMLDLAFDFFDSTVDPIGIIATGFYNNFLINSYLKSSATIEDKEKVAKIFAKYYGCEGKNGYESQLTTRINAEGFKEIVLNKETCTNIIFEYANCNGSLESTIKFLDECLYANRYIAETSIDAAKNDYKIIDMFNHMDVVMALGSDKALTVKLQDKPGKFLDIIHMLSEAQGKQYSEYNMFDLFLLDYSSDKSDRGIIQVKDIEDINKFFADKDSVFKEFNEKYGFANSRPAVGVPDSLYCLKKELVNYTNNLIVFAAKELEMFVSNYNVEAFNARKEIIKEAKETIFNNNFYNAQKVMKGLLSNITDVVNKFSEEKEVEEVNSKIYLKDTVVKIFRNSIIAAFKGGKTPLTDAEIGLCFLGTIVEMNEKALEKGKVGSTHSTAANIFDKYILAYLESKGIETRAYEAIVCSMKNNRTVSLDEFVDEEVNFVDGLAKIDNNFFVAKNKHLNMEGTIVKEDDKFYVRNSRKTIDEDYSLGVYIPMKKTINNVGKFDLTTDFARMNMSLINLTDVKFVFNENVDIATKQGVQNQRIRTSIVGRGTKKGKVFNYHACELLTNACLINTLRNDSDAIFNAFYNTIKDEDNKIVERSGFVQYKSEFLTSTLESIQSPKEDSVEEPIIESNEPVVETVKVVNDTEIAIPVPEEEVVKENTVDEENIVVNDSILLGNFEF